MNSGEIHVWHFEYKKSLIEWDLLSSDEKTRAEQFHFAKDRLFFAFSRTKLRRILSQYLNLNPAVIRFHYTSHKKPFLDPEQNPNNLHFNISHSHQVVSCAISKDYEVGLDIEYMKNTIDYLSIAKNFFSPYEYNFLIQADKSEQLILFYQIWACKEAFIKGTGLGFSCPLSSFDVGGFTNHSAKQFARMQTAKILRMEGDENIPQAWSLFYWTPYENYSAALATRITMPVLLHFH